MGVETTNGDGFGVGWYGEDREPGLYLFDDPGMERSEPA